MERIVQLTMVTPFSSDLAALEEKEQVVLLKGCALCRITRDLDNDSARNKPEWKACKQELGVPIEVLTVDRANADTLAAIEDRAPAVCAVTEQGRVVLLLDADAIARCHGSVTDFRGRLAYRMASLDLRI